MDADKLQNVSIVIPCRNEEYFIGKCLDSIINNEYPKDKLEVLVVDGMSDDGTNELVKRYSEKYPFIRLFDNEKKITPAAMNLGIRVARGDYIIILSSHSKIAQSFVKANIDAFNKYAVDCIGGILITLPANETLIAQSIALALSHPFGVGNAYFRIGLKESRYVDTVPFGCYKREVFEKIGFFDEDLVRNQDDEFNLRLIKNGGKILLSPDIISYYYARDSLLKLWKMYYQYGYLKPLVVEKVGALLTWRQLIPSVFICSLIVSGIFSLLIQQFLWLFFLIILLYLFANLTFSFSTAISKGFKYFFYLPIVFATLHFSYGFSYLKGIIDFFVLKNHKKKQIKDLASTR